MPTILKTKSIYYNDCNLIAQPASIIHRSEIPKELHRIVVSPMEAVVGSKFALEANKLGLTVCLHRFCEPEDELNIFETLPNPENVFVSVGLDNDWERFMNFLDDGAENFLIDTANGYLSTIPKMVDRMLNTERVKKIMIGNVMTAKGYEPYVDYADILDGHFYVRTGIAGGAACSTSDSTGFNRGQITEIMECSAFTDFNQLKIVADGGIKNGNYASKAFGAGADFVMMGSYFSRALEAETHILGDGTYWGGSSYKQQERWGGKKKHSEGKVIKIEEKLESLSLLVDELWGGISSAVSYSGYNTLTNFISNGTFEIKENSLPPGR